jgi:hypothetical protein
MGPIFVPESPGGGYPGLMRAVCLHPLKETQKTGDLPGIFEANIERDQSEIKARSKRRSEPLKKTRKRPEKDRKKTAHYLLSTIYHIPLTPRLVPFS